MERQMPRTNVDLKEPLKYVGGYIADSDRHDGALRPVVGVHNIQAFRANREHPEWADGLGWTYAPAPFLAYWNSRFYMQHYMNEIGEHTPPALTMLTTSDDGFDWGKPKELFPVYVLPPGTRKVGAEQPVPPGTAAVMHQRMGFFAAPNGKLLSLGFYAIVHHEVLDIPNDGKGIGRVVREIRADDSLGPIYFIRLNRGAGWNESNVKFPFYTESDDDPFKEACAALLENALMVQQWAEEAERGDPLITVENPGARGSFHKAFCWYTLPDGLTAVGLWKSSKAAVSRDRGRSWSPVVYIPTFVMNGAKAWGQRTSDGRYAIVHNPVLDGNLRWPLALTVSEDGLIFDKLLAVHGEVPPIRYAGLYKALGPGYIRGIEEGNGTPSDGDMWLTYTVNKEDLWVSRVPVPIRDRVEEPVNDHFGDFGPGGHVPGWNVYSPVWASVSIVASRGEAERNVLQLEDEDPYDYAKAVRVFPESTEATIAFRLQAGQTGHGLLHIELHNGQGVDAIRIALQPDGVLNAGSSSGRKLRYERDEWLDFVIRFDTSAKQAEISINGIALHSFFRRNVITLERLVFRTGKKRTEPHSDSEYDAAETLPDAGEKAPKAVYRVQYVKSFGHRTVTNAIAE